MSAALRGLSDQASAQLLALAHIALLQHGEPTSAGRCAPSGRVAHDAAPATAVAAHKHALCSHGYR